MYLLILVLMLSSVFASELPSPRGFYSNGSIQNAVQLSDSGDGFIKLFVPRNRAWGSQEIISMIIDSSAELRQKHPERDRLQIGDIGAQNGGQITRHGSHQNGLDVDLAYLRINNREQRPEDVGGFDELMVINKKISSNFDIERNWELVKALHKYAEVQRIFMDPLIKKALCAQATKLNELQSQESVLQSIRPYPNHADHLHVRLKCPPYAKECVPQEDTPQGSGCSNID